MSYYTKYKIECSPKVLERLKEVSGYDFEDTAKWYSCETDTRRVSREFPTELITITGYGEDNDDVWRAYALNGYWQYAKAELVFEPCTLEAPKTERVIVPIEVLGAIMHVQIECVTGLTHKDHVKLAKERIKALL